MRMKSFWKAFAVFSVSGIIFGSLLLMAFVAYTAVTTPELKLSDVSPDGYRSQILDDEGNVIQILAGEASNRVYVTLDQIPKNLQNAIIAIEDERFYTHKGIDLQGIARAMWKDITSGSLKQGASTITQQLIKNNVLTDWVEEKTAVSKVTRKLREQVLAVRLEKEAGKEWVLENYLNTINLGAGAWGVQTAA